jgi:nitrogen fixation protein FixH/small basic protein
MNIVLPEISMTETLFGGLILAAALFFVTRRLGLSNFWAGVLSGLLPFLMYLTYASQHWAGGDVLAIHFAVFLANAGVLTVFGSLQQKKQSMHWAPRVIIGFFIFLVILNAVLLSIASRGLPNSITSFILPNPDKQKVHTAFPGTVPHDKNKSYQGHLARVQQQREMGWQANLEGIENLQSKQPGVVRLLVRDKEGMPIKSADVTLGLWRVANSRDDQSLQLVEKEPGIYYGEILLPDAGRWLAEIIIEKNDDYYRRQQQLFLDN